MIRYGILGAARIARAFAREKPGNAEIAAIASRDIEKAKDFAREFQIPTAYGSYEELVQDKTIDAVYISLPHHMHHEYTIRCADVGKHVLCEKPATLSVKEMVEMDAACKKNGVLFMEAFMYRFLPVHRRVKELVDKGKIGKLRYINFNFCIDLKSQVLGTFRGEKEAGGGALYDLGVYGINLSRYMTGREPEVLESRIHRETPDSMDELTFVTLRLGNVISRIACSYTTFAYSYTVSGDKGVIHVPTGNTGKMIENKLIFTPQGDYSEDIEIFAAMSGYRAQAEYFAECIEKGEVPILNGEDSVRQLSVVEAVLEKEKPLF